jgi:hypothetical protein
MKCRSAIFVWTMTVIFGLALVNTISAQTAASQGSAASAAANQGPTGYRTVRSNSAYVRTNPHGYVIGTLFGPNGPVGHTDHMEVYSIADGLKCRRCWAGGYAEGNAKLCGWVGLEEFEPNAAPHHIAACQNLKPFTAPRAHEKQLAYLKAHFASKVNPGRTGDGSTARLQRTTTLFGNYNFQCTTRTGCPHDAEKRLELKDFGSKVGQYGLKWRYVTKDGRYVMVRYFRREKAGVKTKVTQWGFIERCAVSAPGTGLPRMTCP